MNKVLHAAEGYARVSGKTGVVVVTSGPGATNAITGITDAYCDSSLSSIHWTSSNTRNW